MCAFFLCILDKHNLLYLQNTKCKSTYYQMQNLSTNRIWDKVEADVNWSECVCSSTAALWCLILFKSGLRKNQSCCWPSLFGAPGVSIAPGHETHRIYAGDKEGGFHNARWSASDLYLSLTCVSVREKRGEETNRKDAQQLLLKLIIQSITLSEVRWTAGSMYVEKCCIFSNEIHPIQRENKENTGDSI